MKDLTYYSTIGIPYFGYDESVAYRNKLITEINDTPMTANDRDAAIKEVKAKVTRHALEQNAQYKQKEGALLDEFWADCREEYDYTRFLTEAGWARLESLAWENGHSGGFSDVYYQLGELCEFAEHIVKNHKMAMPSIGTN